MWVSPDEAVRIKMGTVVADRAFFPPHHSHIADVYLFFMPGVGMRIRNERLYYASMLSLECPAVCVEWQSVDDDTSYRQGLGLSGTSYFAIARYLCLSAIIRSI